MSAITLITTTVDYILLISCLFILTGCVYLTFKMRFIQLRFFPALFRMIVRSFFNKDTEGRHTILPHRALLTAMSTTIGVTSIVGPVLAIRWGGPGAILGFLLTSFFGSAATYTEVELCIRHRKKLDSGEIMGGPMQYLKDLLSPATATWYAIACLILMTTWSGAQANQLAAILDSPLLGEYRIDPIISGGCIAILVLLTLIGGIKRISALSSKLVPLMFALYLGACLWILGANTEKLLPVWAEMFRSSISPYAMATGTAVGGIVSALRWGIFKGMQATEAGVGTQTIPHSMAETKDPVAQGTLAMLSTFTAGFIAFLSGTVALITETWQDPELPLGISMVAASFQQYFSSVGVAVVAVSTLLFAFGTILGNAFNGSHCFGYLTGNKGRNYYFVGSAVMVFLGAIAEVKLIWSIIDIFLAGMALPHMAALMLHAYNQPKQEKEEEVRETIPEFAAQEIN